MVCETENLLTNAETALLGLLAEGAKYPYMLEKEVEERDMRYWTDLSMSSIYKLLKKLEKQGLVTAETEISNENRARKVYELTEAGREALKASVYLILSEPEHVKWRLDIGVSNLALLPRQETVEALKKHRTALEELIKSYGDLLQYLKDASCPVYRYALAKRPVAVMKGELGWLNEYIVELERGGDEVA